MLSRIRQGYFTQGQKQPAPCIPSTDLEDVLPFKDEAQTALFNELVRTAL